MQGVSLRELLTLRYKTYNLIIYYVCYVIVHNGYNSEKFNNWIRHAKPDLTERSCMQYKRSTDKTYGCEPASCDRSAPKLCVTVKKGGQVNCSRIDIFR